MNPIELGIFASRLNAICAEMGVVLQRAAFSPNIRDRLDFSCAIFDLDGELCAQAAHIPVHLGSMAFAMRDIVSSIQWHQGDVVMLNDPFLGGTHLPDITLISPVFFNNELTAFVANRAHHADIGADTPGSMPLSKTLQEEGIIIPPTHLIYKGDTNQDLMQQISSKVSSGDAGQGDFAAQISANNSGVSRLCELIKEFSQQGFYTGLKELNDYAERIAKAAMQNIPDGQYTFSDVMDDDGMGGRDIKISVTITVKDHQVSLDFSGTDAQVAGNINCPLSVVAAAVYYVFRCLMPDYTPACAGSFRPIKISAPTGCFINAQRPAAVSAGNVETSTRIVDVVMGALVKALPQQIPAASHGSMNNLAMGSTGIIDSANKEKNQTAWDYYETMGGGMGASTNFDGLSAVQTHMTNTRNTPIEVMESEYPIIVNRYSVRQNSGGEGKHRGGDGLIREFTFLQPTQITLLTERRNHAPWGLQGGANGKPGRNLLNNKALPAKVSLKVEAGDRLTIETPGGGGWGKE